jgi:hypothetical protein
MKHRYYPQPLSLPLGSTMLGWLFLDRFKAPGWAFGAFWTVMALLWVVAVGLVLARFWAKAEELTATDVEKRLAALEARR